MTVADRIIKILTTISMVSVAGMYPWYAHATATDLIPVDCIECRERYTTVDDEAKYGPCLQTGPGCCDPCKLGGGIITPIEDECPSECPETTPTAVSGRPGVLAACVGTTFKSCEYSCDTNNNYYNTGSTSGVYPVCSKCANGLISNGSACQKPCAGEECEGMLDWTSSTSAGIETKCIRTAPGQITRVPCSYRCAAGYYAAGGLAIIGKPTCNLCPPILGANVTSNPGSTQITNCYIPKNTTISDGTGQYEFTQDCNYSE